MSVSLSPLWLAPRQLCSAASIAALAAVCHHPPLPGHLIVCTRHSIASAPTAFRATRTPPPALLPHCEQPPAAALCCRRPARARKCSSALPTSSRPHRSLHAIILALSLLIVHRIERFFPTTIAAESSSWRPPALLHPNPRQAANRNRASLLSLTVHIFSADTS
jgi:hypothetical protein